MIVQAPPTFMRIITQLEDSPMLDPNEMAAWWLAGRAERTRPADSANLEPNSPADRASRLRLPKLRIAGKAITALCNPS